MSAQRSAHPGVIWREPDPNVDQRIVLDLAAAIHHARHPDCRVVSWEAQIEAYDHWREHGFEGALALLAELEGG